MSFSNLRRSLAALLAVVALAGVAAPSASAERRFPASLVAEVMILENPGICHEMLHSLHTLGYELAEEAFAITYTAKHPSAAQLFHATIKQCRA
jgi:hypothetical protein